MTMTLRWRIDRIVKKIRYAWQRAIRGYDDTDVFELCFNFADRMTKLLSDFKRNNVALLHDDEEDRDLSEEETREVINEMIYYFSRSSDDNDLLYEDMFGSKDHMATSEELTRYFQRLRECRSKALELFSKWCWELWY